jgi:hypothetical protein
MSATSHFNLVKLSYKSGVDISFPINSFFGFTFIEFPETVFIQIQTIVLYLLMFFTISRLPEYAHSFSRPSEVLFVCACFGSLLVPCSFFLSAQ